MSKIFTAEADSLRKIYQTVGRGFADPEAEEHVYHSMAAGSRNPKHALGAHL
jgi:hypothetical protein